MAISNCLFSPTSENPRGFLVWRVLAKLSTKPRNYSQPRPLANIMMKNCKKKIIPILTIFGLSFFLGFSQNSKSDKTEKPTVLILIPYDLNANGGFSPDTQEIIENKLADNSEIKLIKFPLKKLMNIPYQNVYDRKYCEPILEKIKTDFIIMTKLNLENILSSPRKWDLSFRIYDVKKNEQFDSKLKGEKLTKQQIETKIKNEIEILINEIKKHQPTPYKIYA